MKAGLIMTRLATSATCMGCLFYTPGVKALDVTSCDFPKPGSSVINLTTAVLSGVAASDFATIFSNLRELDSKHYSSNKVDFTLPDGTVLSGLYFKTGDSNRPLLIASFGVMVSSWDSATKKFVQLVEAGEINANVLILDSPSSAPFYLKNKGSLSFGGYDEGQNLIQLAKQLKENNGKGKINFSTISLMGVSLSGSGVLFAVGEDSRQHLDLFKSAITFNSVVNVKKSIGTYLSYTGHPLEGFKAPPPTESGALLTVLDLSDFDSRVKKSGAPTTGFTTKSSGDLIYQAFARRLQNMKNSAAEGRTNWSSEIKTNSVESYLTTQNLGAELSQRTTPVTMVHSMDDEIVPYSDFSSIVTEQKENSYLQTMSTPRGGHWGFFAAYGKKWTAEVINNAIAKSSTHPLSENCQNAAMVPQSPKATTDVVKGEVAAPIGNGRPNTNTGPVGLPE